MFKNAFAATLNLKSCAKLFSKTQWERMGSEDCAPPQRGLGRASGGAWQGSSGLSASAVTSSFLPVAPLVRILAGSSPLSSSHHNRCPRKEASPQVALVLWVHGRARLAAKVLGEVARVGHGADDSEPGRAVRIRDDALVWAFRRPGRAPHLQVNVGKRNVEEVAFSTPAHHQYGPWQCNGSVVQPLKKMSWHTGS